MLTHVVCFKFNDSNTAAEALQRLRGLVGNVPTLKELEAGLDITRSERSYDVALITRFDDAEGLEAYRVHPKHQEVVAFIKENATGTVAVDFLGS